VPADSVDAWGLPVWPAAERNKQPIVDVLADLLADRSGVFLELSSATGQHIAHFAPALSQFTFVPSDFDEEHLVILRKRVQLMNLPNLLPPVEIDVTRPSWNAQPADDIYNANMVHIAPWEAAEGLFRGAARYLKEGGLLITYGPYAFSGKHTSESNAEFDASLRARDPSWGVRDVRDLQRVATTLGFSLREPVAMPKNNFILVWDLTRLAAESAGRDDASP
jgi:SAM-dependent methyltransferase